MTAIPTTYYTTIQKVADFMGLYRKIRPDNPAAAGSESVGTGDGTSTVFYLDNYNVIPNSEQIYVAGVLKTVTTDYTIDADAGKITFVSAPANLAAITANYNYLDIAPSVVGNYINRAEEQIDRRVGRNFRTSQTATAELYDGDAVQETTPYAFGPPFSDGFRSNSPSDELFVRNRALFLKNYPILTVSALSVDGTAVSSTDYKIYYDQGYLLLTDTGVGKFTLGQQNISVTYTYGYSSVPKIVEELATKMAACYVMESLLLGDPSQNLNIREQNIAIIRDDIKTHYESLGEMLEVRRI